MVLYRNLANRVILPHHSARGQSREIFNVVQFVKCKFPRALKAIFHCSRFAHAGEVTDFNLVKNQSRVHAKKGKCSSTSRRTKADRKRSD